MKKKTQFKKSGKFKKINGKKQIIKKKKKIIAKMTMILKKREKRKKKKKKKYNNNNNKDWHILWKKENVKKRHFKRW